MAFHWQNGWYFERLDDGSVRIYHQDPVSKRTAGEGEFAEYDTCIDIHMDSWASIVASVCARGETGETWREALQFHNK